MTASFSFSVPDWVADINARGMVIPASDDRMTFVVEASRRNADTGGGPFAAGVFESETGKLVALGVNVVVAQGCCILHAEMVAIMLAQRALNSYDFSQCSSAMELVTSCEPCAMCYGAVPWSGVRKLVCAAREADARQAGFDEGAKAEDWVGALSVRGIEVHRDVCREPAAHVLMHYAASGGEIYNGRRDV